jgi:hypothetical protein
LLQRPGTFSVAALAAQVFAGFGADRLRTAITRATKATGVPG